MDILTNMCKWWPLWWILPAILGWLLGRVMMMKWKTRTEELEKEVADWKDKHAKLEDDLAACRSRAAELDSDLALERGRIRETERANKYLQADLDDLKKQIEDAKSSSTGSSTASTAAAAGASALGASSSKPKSESSDSGSSSSGTAGEGKWSKLRTNNMQIIEGIGPKMDQVLNDNGISSWAVLAGKSFDELRALLDQEKYEGKYNIVDPSDWAAQAALAAKGDWEGLIKYQSDDGSASKAESVLVKLGIRDA